MAITSFKQTLSDYCGTATATTWKTAFTNCRPTTDWHNAISWADNSTTTCSYDDEYCTIPITTLCNEGTYSSYIVDKYIRKIQNYYYTTSDTDCTYCHYIVNEPQIITPEDRIRQIIRERQAPMIITSNQPVHPTMDVKEICARETLRRVLRDDEFKSYLRKGFVSVQAKSGKVYQIFPGHGITNVYMNGQKIERLCVVLRGNFPPTDSLIMRYLLILNDEADFRKLAVSHVVSPKKFTPSRLDLRTLPEIFQAFKKAG